MFTKLIDFFRPPEYDNIERTQKAKFLHFALLVSIVANIFLGIQNMPGKSDLGIILFILAGISFLCLPANKLGYYFPTAIFISTLVLVVITFSLIVGVGLQDAGLIAYPIFIIFSTFLFNKRAAFITTIFSAGSVFLVYYLGQRGQLKPAIYSNENQLFAIFILLISTGLLIWAVLENWERVMYNLRETYDLTLSGWGKALEYRDQETQGHSQRVVGMTIELAKRLDIPERKMEHIRRGALLHDIGKMAIPDAILLKGAILTEEEWEIVKMHPFYAKNLLEKIPYLKPALDIPYSHHERWNGSGYPQGLSKDEIPFAARIFAVADVWDALTSNRPYRPGWTKDEARDYIWDQSGILFDPQVVKVFMEYLENNKI